MQCNVEEFIHSGKIWKFPQLSHWEIWNISTTDVENFIFFHICHVEIYQFFHNLWGFVAIYVVLVLNLFCCDLCRFGVKSVLLWFMLFFFAKLILPQFMRLCVEKNWAQKCVCGEKLTNMRSVLNLAVRFTQVREAPL